MVPNIISGLYGMNVRLPLAGSPYAFLELSAIIVIISALVLILFIRRRFF
jgi:magnesium transporter